MVWREPCRSASQWPSPPASAAIAARRPGRRHLDRAVTDGRKRYQVARGRAGATARPSRAQTRSATGGTLAAQARAFAQRVGGAGRVRPTADLVSRPQPRRPRASCGSPSPSPGVASGRRAVWRRGCDRRHRPWPLRPSPSRGRPAAKRRTAAGVQRLGSAVAIRCTRTLGAGFFVAEDTVMTNAHVVCPPGDTMRVVLRSGRALPPTPCAGRSSRPRPGAVGVRGAPSRSGTRACQGRRAW